MGAYQEARCEAGKCGPVAAVGAAVICLIFNVYSRCGRYGMPRTDIPSYTAVVISTLFRHYRFDEDAAPAAPAGLEGNQVLKSGTYSSNFGKLRAKTQILG
jgi:hypothetical protein